MVAPVASLLLEVIVIARHIDIGHLLLRLLQLFLARVVYSSIVIIIVAIAV